MRTLLLIAPLALIAAAGPQGDRLDAATQVKLDKRLAGYTAGQQSSCVPITYRSLNTTAYGPLLVYQQGRGPIYVNDTGGGCENAARGDVLVSVQYEGRPCSGDIIRTVDPYSRTTTGSCALGRFTPYTRSK